MQFTVVIGNPRPGGRTTTAATAVAGRVAADTTGATIEVIELADHAGRLFSPDDADVARLNDLVASSDLAVFACPTYKASFTGLLKAFLDRYGNDGLRGVVAIPVMLGASPTHALAPETQLRPVLVELGATVPSRAVFVVDSEMDRLDDTLDRWWQTARQPIGRALARP